MMPRVTVRRSSPATPGGSQAQSASNGHSVAVWRRGELELEVAKLSR